MLLKADHQKGVYWYYKDQIGSTRQLDNSSMQVDYFPYGEERVTAGNETAYKFSGKERDSGIGLDYFGSRYYAYNIGRWLVPDPAGQGFSPYSYCGNSPLMMVDPDGEWAFLIPIFYSAIVAGTDASQSGGDFWSAFGKGALSGAISSAVGYGLSSELLFNRTMVGAIEGAGYGLVSGAVGGAVGNAIMGEDIGWGALNGAVGGAAMGGLRGYDVANAMGHNPWTGAYIPSSLGEVDLSGLQVFYPANTNISRIGISVLEACNTWDIHSNMKIALLDYDARIAATALLNNAESEGMFLRVTSGYRTIAEQNNLYAKGRTQKQLNKLGLKHVKAQPNEKIVTKAMGGKSIHNFRRAIDVVEIHGRKALWTNKNWNRIGSLGQQVGFVWGGSWKNFTDRPHFQLP